MIVPNGLSQAQVDKNNLNTQGDLVLATRQSWYHNIGDPLYMKEQRGEVASGTWKAAVAEMKAKNPYPNGYAAPTPEVAM